MTTEEQQIAQNAKAAGRDKRKFRLGARIARGRLNSVKIDV
jgi:hypothetical protein